MVVAAGETCVTKASLVTVGDAVNVGTLLNAIRLSGVGVAGTNTAGAGVSVAGTYPTGVGVKYWPHSDAFPTQDVVTNEMMINKPRMRFTVGPLRELYLY